MDLAKNKNYKNEHAYIILVLYVSKSSFQYSTHKCKRSKQTCTNYKRPYASNFFLVLKYKHTYLQLKIPHFEISVSNHKNRAAVSYFGLKLHTIYF